MKKWMFLLIIIFGIITTSIFKHKFILTKYAEFFTINNAKPGADAIFVLSGRQINRIPHALNLFNKGFAPRLLLTKQKKSNKLFSHLFYSNQEIAEAMANELKIRAPINTIPSVKGGATSTFDEAYDLLNFSKNNNLNHLILVTDTYHTRRAYHAFKHVFAETNIQIEMSAAKNEIFDKNNWWTSDQGISAYVLESIKYPIYLFSSKNADFIKND